jgi:hypothetical protein
MEEEGNVHMRYSLAEHGREEEKMVIMDHDNIAWLVELEDSVREFLVHTVVVCP